MDNPISRSPDTSAEERALAGEDSLGTRTTGDTEPRGRRSSIRARLSRLPSLTLTVVTTLGVLVTALTPIGGALAKVLPNFIPDPREPIAASLKVVVVEPDATLEDLRHRVADRSQLRGLYRELFNTAIPSPRMLATRGDLVYLRMSLDGFQHRDVLIRGRLYYADGTLVRGEDVPPIPETRVGAPDGASLLLIFVPASSKLTAVRKTFIRLELLGGDGERIAAVVDTPLLRRGKPPRAFAQVAGP